MLSSYEYAISKTIIPVEDSSNGFVPAMSKF